MGIINLTPHADGVRGMTFQPSGTVARLEMAPQSVRPDAAGVLAADLQGAP